MRPASEKSDLGLCQLADTMVDRLKLGKLGVSVRSLASVFFSFSVNMLNEQLLEIGCRPPKS